MAIYDTTFMNNATNPLELITGISSAIGSDFLLGNIILLAFSVIFLIIGFRSSDIVTVLIMDGFITTIIAILLTYAGMVSAVIIAYPVLMFSIALIFRFISN